MAGEAAALSPCISGETSGAALYSMFLSAPHLSRRGRQFQHTASRLRPGCRIILALAHNDADFRNLTLVHFANHQIQFAEAHIVTHSGATAKLAIDVLRQRH